MRDSAPCGRSSIAFSAASVSAYEIPAERVNNNETAGRRD